MDNDEPLAELNLARHRDLVGRRHEHWARRIAVAVLVVFVALAAANAFGQAPQTSTAASPAARMSVSTPSRIREGLIFQTRVDLTVARTVKKPTLVLSGGWFDGITLNSIEPVPTAQSPAGTGVAMAFPALAAGDHTIVWLQWSANPTNLAWQRGLQMQLRDGSNVLLTMHRTVTVFP